MAAASVGGKHLLLVGLERSVLVRTMDTWRQVDRIAIGNPTPMTLSVSTNGERLLVTGGRHSLARYSLLTGKHLDKIGKDDVRGGAEAMARCPKTGRIALALKSGGVGLLEPDGVTFGGVF